MQRNVLSRSFVTCLLGVWMVNCREVDENGASTPVDPSDIDGDSEVETAFVPPIFDLYDCASVDATRCDTIACRFRAISDLVEERCFEQGKYACSHAEICLSVFSDGLQNICPPGAVVPFGSFYRHCATELSACLTDLAHAAPWSLNSRSTYFGPNDGGDLMSRTPDGLHGFWYTFADSDDEAMADSVISIDYQYGTNDVVDRICVEGIASQVKAGEEGVFWGAGFGGDLCSNDTLSECYGIQFTPEQFLGVRFDIEGDWGSELRVLFHEKDVNESAYVVVPDRATHVVALVDHASVWYNPGKLVDRNNLDAIQLHIATNANSPTPFSFCVRNMAVLIRQNEAGMEGAQHP